MFELLFLKRPGLFDHAKISPQTKPEEAAETEAYILATSIG